MPGSCCCSLKAPARWQAAHLFCNAPGLWAKACPTSSLTSATASCQVVPLQQAALLTCRASVPCHCEKTNPVEYRPVPHLKAAACWQAARFCCRSCAPGPWVQAMLLKCSSSPLGGSLGAGSTPGLWALGAWPSCGQPRPSRCPLHVSTKTRTTTPRRGLAAGGWQSGS